MNVLPIPYEKALAMAQKYCAYQDRCTAQVLEWCRQKQLQRNDTQRLLLDLERNGYLDDNRFAGAFARGKFRNNKWGRVKISAGLKAHKIDPDLIETALSEIDESDYMLQLKSLLCKKVSRQSETLSYPEHMRIAAWAAAKGYERPLIMEALKQLSNENTNECE